MQLKPWIPSHHNQGEKGQSKWSVSYLLIAEGSQSSTSGRVGNRLITEWSRAKPRVNEPGEDSAS